MLYSGVAGQEHAKDSIENRRVRDLIEESGGSKLTVRPKRFLKGLIVHDKHETILP